VTGRGATEVVTRIGQRVWERYVAAFERYHRFELDGLPTLLAAAPCIAVGYHGRGLPLDLGMVAHRVWRERGYWPRSVIHKSIFSIPILGSMFRAVGAIPEDVPSLRAALDGGEVVIVAPGGTHEGLRAFHRRYRVDWGRRRGYLRLAGALGVPLVPVASDGVDERFFSLNDGHAWGRRLRLPGRLPFWIAFGPLGVWPLTPPFPVRIRTRIGQPIAIHAEGTPRPDDPDWLEAMHARVTASVQRLLDELRE
jgi:1-acyl-sn-glycerol-3-phosphate acyltransferase